MLSKNYFFLLLFLIGCSQLSAQMQPDSVKTNDKQATSYYKASLNYLSNAVWQGRKDETATPYLTPSIGYYNKKGWYVEGSLSYLAAKESGIDLLLLNAGYDFNITSNLTAAIAASKYFYNKSSYNVKAQAKGDVTAAVSYDFNNIVSLSETGGIIIAPDNDYLLTSEISHQFDLGKTSKWRILPTAAMNMGTQNSYHSYVVNRKFVATRRRRINTNNSITVNVLSPEKFQVLDYEFSVPVSYDKNKWGFQFTPAYAMPVHPIQYTVSNTNKVITDPLSNSFYAEAEIYIKF